MNIQPFTIAIPQTTLDDLHQRLALTRWPDEILASGWDYGANLTYMKDLVRYWQTTFDWRSQERVLNTFLHFRATIDDLNIHFVHERGKGPNPLPIILTHGWPSSFVEMLKILPLLTDPARYEGDPTDAFDVVVPSLPGYGFSDRAPNRGMTDARIADVWSRLMSDVLGYPRFGAHGGDIGGSVTFQLGRFHPEQLIGIHVNGKAPRPYLGPDVTPLSEQERVFLAEDPELGGRPSSLRGQERWDADEVGYMLIQHNKPQTLAYGLNDSPAGLAAWIIEKFRAWSDCDGDVERCFTKTELLTNVSIYWFTQTINSSFGPYYVEDDERDPFRKGERVEVPCAVALFPKNMGLPPRRWAERVYNLQRWTHMPRGGHFPALEEPELLVEDIRAFFRPLREPRARERAVAG
ncbi:MAG: epoxide hydrolase family protein [Ktedonobacterales bacterium]